ncbi:MAG: 6,7-dimethyl-8-ribityllumazine synthase [Nitrosomonas sp.]|jgi:6,7-dimethyl-8-ribityllumazine synthase|nr:MAG: 6,7-dimethyl-8-ribityllumazine synthase [Nitrosomonas sp.]
MVKGIDMAYSDNINEIDPDLDGAELHFGIVMSRFNIEIGEGLLGACIAELNKYGVQESNLLLVTVPGALEIPVALQKMALLDQFDAMIALGSVIRGETYHFDVVSNESTSGLTNVSLDLGIPIANGILTTETIDQAIARMGKKGADVARVAIEMGNLITKLDEMEQ